MNAGFFRHLLLICQFELKRFFLTKKGILFLITFTLVWFIILLYPFQFISDLISRSQDSIRPGGFFDFIGLSFLLNWQIPEFGVYWRFSLLIFPLLSLIITSDQTSSDRERGTMRFLSLRANRSSLFFGRFAAAMVNQFFLILLTLITTLIMVVYRDSSLLALAFNNVLMIAISLIIVLLPFTAMMAILSAKLKSAKLATTWAVLIWVFLASIISGLAFYLPGLEVIKVLIPGYQMPELVKLADWQILQLTYIPILQSLVLLLIGHWIMSRQNL